MASPLTTAAETSSLESVDEAPDVLVGSATAAFFKQVDLSRARWNPLSHPFFRCWVEGAHLPPAIRIYASEHHHLVDAVDQLSRDVAQVIDGPLGRELLEYATAGTRQRELWLAFARSVGWGGMDAIYYGEDPFSETKHFTRLCESREPSHMLLTLYCLKASQPELSRARLAGLLGMGHPDDASTAYFRVDWTRDLQHAFAARQALAERLPAADQSELLQHAENVNRGVWAILDAVEAYSAR